MIVRASQRRTAPILVTVAALGAAAGLAPPATAAVLQPCRGEARAHCGRLTVPLDRGAAVAGNVSLAVKLVRAPGRSRGTVLFLPGGPGQASTPLSPVLTDPRGSPLGPVLRTHDLLLVDQRGTGASGLLRCPLLELTNAGDPAPEVAACAHRLGPGRDYFQTRDSVDDLEAVRAALHLRRLSIVGVSYGTKVALSYARRYPGAVERLVLDSVVVPSGPDPYLRDTFAAIPRVLGELCHGPCRRINPDPLGDLRDLVATLRAGPALGFAVGLDGRRHAARLSRSDLLGIMVAGDLGPSPIFAELPAALRSARQGDLGPLLRLERVAGAVNAEIPPRLFSAALLVATTCTEVALPWSASTPPEQRRAAAAAAVGALGDGPFAPFDSQTAVESGFIALCAAWPSPTRSPEQESGPLPAVPTLLLDGTRDLRTPLESARSLAAALPRALVVPVAGVGHSTLTSDFTGCPSRVVARFFAGRPVGGCSRGRPLIPPIPVAPTALAQLPALPGLPPPVGRTACAVGMTLGDAGIALLGGSPTSSGQTLTVRAAGLRAGTVVARVRLKPTPRGVLTLERFSFVRDVTVSGNPRRGLLRVSGRAAAPGAVSLQGRRLVGRLGGRPVDVSLGRCAGGGLRPMVLVPASGSSLGVAVIRPGLG